MKVDMPLNKETNPNQTQTSTTTQDQGGPGSNGNQGVFHNPPSSRTGASL